jgi:DNA polymerase III alpha subunit
VRRGSTTWSPSPADGQPGVAITDHGVMYGVVDFVRAAKAHGIKPIIGIEAYFTDGSRFDRPPAPPNSATT